MLEQLDSIDWASLGHAYGSAEDVPHQLRSLLSEDVEIRKEALYELFGNIHHQGTVYEASSYAIPFLVEILDDPNCQVKDDIILLLACIAGGSGYLEVHAVDDQGQLNLDEIPAEYGMSLKDEMQKEAEIIKMVRVASSPLVLRLLTYLTHNEPEIRLTIAMMLPYYPEHFGITIPALEMATSTESDEEVQESMQSALDEIKKRNSSQP